MLIQTHSQQLIATAENWWVDCALAALDWRGRFDVALSGGRTPRRLYQRLARNRLLRGHWGQIGLWFGDERAVPPAHADSNYRMVLEAGLNPELGVQLERIPGELEPTLAAERYAKQLGSLPQRGGWPLFDLVMLGMGADGHIASLFPGSANLAEGDKPVSACPVAALDSWRISLTLPVIANARRILVLVAGADKAEMLQRVLHKGDPAYPASQIARLDQADWLVALDDKGPNA
ncbi:6-phosphogluconolactonase [Magnetovirga frankeli]|uniref:6-phosphogluconolactonase n=1 Tax=Magnetovirga frankeli TaxID=947516 RepID=UPI00129366DB|nr:6-phosphogluconolactonase [gamma proteobacterium SS-5]